MITSAVEERTQLPMCQRRGKFLLRWPVRIKTTQAQRVGPHVGGGPHVAAVVQVACSCTHVAGPYCTTRSCDRNVACCDVSGVRWLCDIMSSCCSLSLLVGVRETWIAGARRASGAACALLGRRRRPRRAAACCQRCIWPGQPTCDCGATVAPAHRLNLNITTQHTIIANHRALYRPYELRRPYISLDRQCIGWCIGSVSHPTSDQPDVGFNPV